MFEHITLRVASSLKGDETRRLLSTHKGPDEQAHMSWIEYASTSFYRVHERFVGQPYQSRNFHVVVTDLWSEKWAIAMSDCQQLSFNT